MATVGPEPVARWAQEHEVVDAPVSGGVARAADGDLLIMVSGAGAAIERVRPLLDTLARNAPVVGDEPGDGQKVKLVNQLLCGVHIAAAAEALAFAESLGLDARATWEVVRDGAAASFMLDDRGARMLDEAFEEPKSALDIFVKDMGLVGEAARASGQPSPLAAVAEQLYRAGSRAGLGRLDDSSLITLLRRANDASHDRRSRSPASPMITGCGSCASCGAATTARSARRPRAGTGSTGRLERGIGVTVGMQAMNSLDQLQPVPGMGPVGEYRLMPDLDTFRVLPYAPHTGAVLTDHCGLDGEPAPVCQRSFLKRMRRRLAERGLTLRVAFENEFSLAAQGRRRLRPGRHRPVLLDDRHDRLAGLRGGARRRARRARSCALEQYYAELGHGQQEISTAHAPALQAADEQLLVRETIRGVASAARAGGVAGAQAVAGERGQRRPRALLALGGRAQPLLRPRRAERARAAPSWRACSSTCPACAA